MSFIHQLLKDNDPEDCLDRYIEGMTSNYNISLTYPSFYAYWKDRMNLDIEPVRSKVQGSFQFKKNESDILLELFIKFLFSEDDYGGIEHPSGLDMVGTNLVMIEGCNSPGRYLACMTEPIIIIAGLNFMTDTDSAALMRYFASKLFASINGVGLTPQERSNLLEMAIAIRFRQAWWAQDGMSK